MFRLTIQCLSGALVPIHIQLFTEAITVALLSGMAPLSRLESAGVVAGAGVAVGETTTSTSTSITTLSVTTTETISTAGAIESTVATGNTTRNIAVALLMQIGRSQIAMVVQLVGIRCRTGKRLRDKI